MVRLYTVPGHGSEVPLVAWACLLVIGDLCFHSEDCPKSKPKSFLMDSEEIDGHREEGGWRGGEAKKMSGLFDLGSREEGGAIFAVLLHGTIKFIP